MLKKVKIIAEIGVNHNGDIKIAKKLIDKAKFAGAHFVKFQTFNTDLLVSKNLDLLKYQKNQKFKTQHELLKSLELSKKIFFQLFAYCKKKRIKFLSTPFDVESALFLRSIGQKIFKIPSGEIDNYPLLFAISKIADKVFLSTGMSNINEIKSAINILTRYKIKKKDIVVLHCTSQYPAKIKNINLLAMQTIKEKLNVSVGYSDHTIGSATSILATSLGAEIIEKHITLNNKMSGPDHKASMEINKLQKFIKDINSVKIILGSSKKQPTKDEKKIIKKIRKSIFARKFIAKGDMFSEKNIITKRPQIGLSPMNWKRLIGKKSKKNFRADDLIII